MLPAHEIPFQSLHNRYCAAFDIAFGSSHANAHTDSYSIAHAINLANPDRGKNAGRCLRGHAPSRGC